MSKQLAISSAFAVFAMAAMTLSVTAELHNQRSGDALVATMAEAPSFDWPKFSLFPGS